MGNLEGSFVISFVLAFNSSNSVLTDSNVLQKSINITELMEVKLQIHPTVTSNFTTVSHTVTYH